MTEPSFTWFALPVCVAFALPIQLSLSQHMSSLTITFQLSSLNPLGMSERVTVELSCQLELNYDRGSSELDGDAL